MPFSAQEIIETIRMVQMEKLDIRTITLGISLRDCGHPDLAAAAARAYDKICRLASRLLAASAEIEREYGIPIVNTRISVTPIALVAESSGPGDYVIVAEALDRAAREVGVNFIGGYSALVHKGMTLEQIKAAQPTRGFTRRFGSSTGPWTTDMFVDAVYAGVAKEGKR